MADLNKAQKIINEGLERLKKSVGKVEPKLTDFILEWVQKFETSSGNIMKSQKNKDRFGAFKRAVERYLLQSGYNDMIFNFVQNFGELEVNQQQIQQAVNGLKITKDEIGVFKTFSIRDTLDKMQGQGLSLALVKPLENELFTAVYQGSSLRDVLTSLENQLQTTPQRSGIITRLVTQAGRDSLGQYNGKVNEYVRKVYKMDAVLYVGSLVKDSRPQCIRWTQETENFGQKGLILFEDLGSEIIWANNNGSGMIPGTTPEMFTENRGGYNCRHDAYPVRTSTFKQ